MSQVHARHHVAPWYLSDCIPLLLLAVNYSLPDVIYSLFHATVGLCVAAVPSLLLAEWPGTPDRYETVSAIHYCPLIVSVTSSKRFCFQIRPLVICASEIVLPMHYISQHFTYSLGSPSITTTTILFLQCRPNSDAQHRLMLARKART